jgi:hypothetical protein
METDVHPVNIKHRLITTPGTSAIKCFVQPFGASGETEKVMAIEGLESREMLVAEPGHLEMGTAE